MLCVARPGADAFMAQALCWKRGHKIESFQVGGMGVAQDRARSVLWSAETAPKATEGVVKWLVVKWGAPWRDGGDKRVRAVFWLCIFCTGSAVNLH